jgi:lipoate-protein ligase A
VPLIFVLFLTGMPTSLRIIRDCAHDAAFNMAADQYLLARAQDLNTVFLRTYSWKPPAVSLGHMQKPVLVLDGNALQREGIDWVKRPTGGRAILHWNDLTYGFVFPADTEGLGSTINESYAVISRCLLTGLELAGMPCTAHDSAADYSATKREIKLPCFLSPNRNEIMVQGKKLVGSAQKRTAGAVLQHGSIPLDGSFRRLPEFLAISQEERARQRALLEKKCIGVNEINPAIDFEKLSACIIKGFTEILKFTAVEKPWDNEELKEIHAIM